MKLLLDTHCWLWWLTEPEKLSQTAMDLLTNRSHTFYLSVASIWEIGIKAANQKLSLPLPPAKLISSQMAEDGIIALDIKSIHALQAAALPMHHRDPFDRMLIAQSQIEQIPIVTTDTMFKEYKVKSIW